MLSESDLTFPETLLEAKAAAADARHEEVLALCDEAATSGLDGNALSELAFLRADALRHLGRWAEAGEAFHSCIAQHSPLLAERRGVRAYRLLTEIERRYRRYSEAAAAARTAIDTAERLGDVTGRLLSQVALARVLSDSGHGVPAEHLAQEAITAARRELAPHDPDRALVLVAAHTNASLFCFRRDALSKAISLIEQVRDLTQHVKHGITLAHYYRQAAILFELSRRYSAAIAHLNRSLDLYELVRFEPGRYDVYWSLARSYTDLGDLRTARLCLWQCVDLAERYEWPLELGKSKSSFAELAVSEGRYDEAIGLYSEDLALSDGLGDSQALGHCHRKLAWCHRLNEEFPQAEAHARESVEHFEATGRLGEANSSRVLLARVLVDAERVDEAAEVLAAARASHTGHRRHAGAELLRTEALVARAQGDLESAAELLAQSLGLQDPRLPTRELAATMLDAGVTARLLWQPEEAATQLQGAAEAAGFIGSRDLWQRAIGELRQVDVMAAEELMLKPYLPHGAVGELRGGDTQARLVHATIMFVDLRGATALSGDLAPLDLADTLDAFLGPVVRIILRYGGTVDKLIGDAVMAVFGAAEPNADGAEEAAQAGVAILDYMEATQRVRRRAGASVLEAAIGMNTGEVVTGCFGPLLRRDYTMLGYHVNLAERLQSLAGELSGDSGTRMVMSGSTRRGLRTPVPAAPVDLSGINLKGIATGDLEAWLVTPASPLR